MNYNNSLSLWKFAGFPSLVSFTPIRISDIQGYQFVEFVPAQPFGNLLEKYEELREKLPKGFHSDF